MTGHTRALREGVGNEARLAEERRLQAQFARGGRTEAQRLEQQAAERDALRLSRPGAAAREAGMTSAESDAMTASFTEIAERMGTLEASNAAQVEREVAAEVGKLAASSGLTDAMKADLKGLVDSKLKGDLEKGGSVLGKLSLTNAVGIVVFIGMLVKSHQLTGEECKNNCRKLLTPEYAPGTFFGSSGGDYCSSDPSSQAGPQAAANCSGASAPAIGGANSDENCCCNPPGGLPNYKTSDDCNSFCVGDCTKDKLRDRAKQALLDDCINNACIPSIANVASNGVDRLLDAGDKGFDLMLTLMDVGPWILGALFIMFIIYFVKGLVTGAKDGAKAVGAAASAAGVRKATRVADKIGGAVTRRGRKLKK